MYIYIYIIVRYIDIGIDIDILDIYNIYILHTLYIYIVYKFYCKGYCKVLYYFILYKAAAFRYRHWLLLIPKYMLQFTVLL